MLNGKWQHNIGFNKMVVLTLDGNLELQFHSHRLSRIYNLKLCVYSEKRHSELHLQVWHSEFLPWILHRCNAVYVVIRRAQRASTNTSVVSAPTLVLISPCRPAARRPLDRTTMSFLPPLDARALETLEVISLRTSYFLLVAWAAGWFLRRFLVRRHTIVKDVHELGKPRPDGRRIKGTAVVCGGRQVACSTLNLKKPLD